MVNILFFMLGVTLVTALQPFDRYKEGSCHKFPTHAVKADRNFVDSLQYVIAGSRYHRFRAISGLPNYSSMRLDEFFYDYCSTWNATTTHGPTIMGHWAFGKLFSTWKMVPKPGMYAEMTPTRPGPNYDNVKLTVTHTDHKTFAILSSCWTRADQGGYMVVSNTPRIDMKTEKMIENHILSLGFKRDFFTFIRYDSCRKGGPIVDSGRLHRHGHHQEDHHDDHHDDHHRDLHNDHHEDHHDDHHDEHHGWSSEH